MYLNRQALAEIMQSVKSGSFDGGFYVIENNAMYHSVSEILMERVATILTFELEFKFVSVYLEKSWSIHRRSLHMRMWF